MARLGDPCVCQSIIIIIIPLQIFHISETRWFLTGVSWTLLSILADLNNAVVWMVSTCAFISNPFINPLVTVPGAPTNIMIVFVSILLFASFSHFFWSQNVSKSI